MIEFGSMRNKLSILISVVYYLGVIVWLSVLTHKVNDLNKPPNIEFELKLNDSEFMKDWDANGSTMLIACEYYGVKHPRIVTAQAILESGNFKSELFRKYNNPFGLYDSKKKDYFKFRHWTDAIVAYISMVEYKYKGGDYYKFLEGLPYASDKRYIYKVKAIESNLPP